MARLAPVMLLVLATGALPVTGGRGVSAEPEARVVPPLADPAVEPGIGRCTSDGACLVTDARGTRAATPLRPAR